MTPEQLKESLLQYAIKGKLVEQIPEEGTADDLLKEIKDEKDKLIAAGKIPKEKKLATISDDEKEFDIPDNWRYVRVQDIASYITDYVANGSFATLKKNTTTYKSPNYAIFVRTMDLTANFVGESSYIDQKSYEFLEKSKLYGGELILPNIGGSIGKAFLMPDLGMPMSLAPNSIMLKFLYQIMNKFFSFVIQSTYGKKFLTNTKGGTATPKFSKTELRNMVVMLPPLKEIERIVAKIEELLPYVDRYAASWEKLEQFNAKFPEEMKRSILQYAIQGKLVEQRAEEGNAEDLYKEIQEEKQKLIKEGKIKNEKPLAEIAEDEIPFDIPESWKWVHLNNIATSNLGKTLNKSTDTGEDCPYLCSINVYWEGISLETVKIAKFDEAAKKKYRLQKGDLLICEGGDAGRSAIWNSEEEMYYQNALHRVRFYGSINPKYICYILECYKKTGTIANYTKGIGIQHLVQTSLNEMWLPLPPLAEQNRIIEKIEQLLPYCNQLIK